MEPFIGTITIFAGNFAPRGWALCDGAILNISDYDVLYSLIGTTYGGDGRVTFGLPDLRGRIPVGYGSGPGLTPWYPGEKRGLETIVLGHGSMPLHSHTLQGSSKLADSTDPTGRVLATEPDETSYRKTSSNLQEMSSQAVTAVGEGQAHENRAPFLAINYIIALLGAFPSRN